MFGASPSPRCCPPRGTLGRVQGITQYHPSLTSTRKREKHNGGTAWLGLSDNAERWIEEKEREGERERERGKAVRERLTEQVERGDFLCERVSVSVCVCV